MKLKFTKMHGCGNDYIYINCFDTEINSPESLSVLLSDRHYSIGGELIINYTDDAVFMTGECIKVFDGMVEI